MEIKKAATVGRLERGDLRVTISPGKGRNIEIKSSIGRMYGDQIRNDCIAELLRLGVHDADVLVEDDGALSYVIAARIEAAVVKASDEKSPHKTADKKVKIQPERLRRSRLYIPGNNPALFPNAWLFGADMLLLDLEDSVPPSEKFSTRYLVRNAILDTDFGDAELAVRINPLNSPYGIDDLEVIIPAGPDVIVLPKAESAEDVKTLKDEITRIQDDAKTKFEIGIVPIIESALGVIRAPEIAAVDDVVMIAFGAEDFTKDIGAERTREGKEQFVARSKVVLAAKAFGKMASDTVFSDLSDQEGLMNSTREAKTLGFDGKGLIHPAQVEVVHKIFAPTEDELVYAVKVIAAAEEAERKGTGVVALGRKMIDPPVVSRARRIMELAKKMKLQIPEIEE